MKLLITGGAGFIGSHFIKYILNKYPDYSVINLDALTYAGDEATLSDIANDKRYTFIKGSITDAELVNKLTSSVDCIVNFAAESHVDRSISRPEAFIKTNIYGTFTLLEAALKNGKKRFHHISTDEVYGSLGKDDLPFSETTSYDPRSPYSASKASSDHLVNAYHHTYGLPTTISNCSNNYGPYHYPEKLIPLAITNILENKKVPIYGDGLQVRDWLYVEDHCKAIDLILHKGTVGETYCIGGGSEFTNKDLLTLLISIMGYDDSVFEYISDRPGHDKRYAINFSKITSELGWVPETSLMEGLKKTVQWYKENQTWWMNKKTANMVK